MATKQTTRTQANRRWANVVYFMQTHTRPAQVARLVRVITEGNPDAIVLISHDKSGQTLDVNGLQALGNVHVLLHRGGYGDFSHVDRYFAAVDWLEENGIDYNWLENLSGQDYPLRPIAEIEARLDATRFDGLIQYTAVFPERVPPEADHGDTKFQLAPPFDAAMRYDYRHWRIGKATDLKYRVMYPFMAINLMQPWVRLSNSYAVVGVRRNDTVFGPGFYCYGGSFFCTLRARTVRYIREYARAHPDVVSFFRTVMAPEETFFHSVLVNSGRFNLTTEYKRYIDWSVRDHTHPKTLDTEDVSAMLSSGAHWGRKLDLSKDPRLFDLLDQRVRPKRVSHGGQASTGVSTAAG